MPNLADRRLQQTFYPSTQFDLDLMRRISFCGTSKQPGVMSEAPVEYFYEMIVDVRRPKGAPPRPP